MTGRQQPLPEAAATAVGIAVGLLAHGELDALMAIDTAHRMQAGDVRRRLVEYGRTLLPMAPGWRDAVDARQTQPNPRTFHVLVPLWTAEEGRSDLTLELELTEIGEGLFDTAVLDLHTL